MRDLKIHIFIKFFIAYIVLHLFRRGLLKRHIWTLGEKTTEARDNGYWLFKYILLEQPGFPVYYVIKKGSPDESKLDKGNVLYYGTFKHFLYSLAAEKCVSGQTHWNVPFYNEKGIGKLYYKLRNKHQKNVWISHGVKKDKIPSYDFRVSGYDLMTVAVKKEYDYYKHIFNIPEQKIALTGLCRFDKLYDYEQKNQILIMPTFRSWLRTSDSSKKRANEEEKNLFVKSMFYLKYIELLQDKRLINLASQQGIKIVFYLHYTFQPYSYIFEHSLSKENRQFIKIAERGEFDVQQLLKESKLLITDYSSVFFDFAYMKKPVVYYQFDKDEYRSKHYNEGYFSYERDGFGPVLINEEIVIEMISQIVKKDFTPDVKYKERMDTFFIPYDNNNCKRSFDAIKELK